MRDPFQLDTTWDSTESADAKKVRLSRRSIASRLAIGTAAVCGAPSVPMIGKPMTNATRFNRRPTMGR